MGYLSFFKKVALNNNGKFTTGKNIKQWQSIGS